MRGRCRSQCGCGFSATIEGIEQKFTSLVLSNVYQVIGYYLKHSAELAEYFDARERQDKELLAAHPEMTASRAE